MSQEKTEKPTERRISDARKEGNVPYSADFSGAATLAAACGLLIGGRDFFQGCFHSIVLAALDTLGGDRAAQSLSQAIDRMFVSALAIVAPFFILALVTTLLATVTQTGFAFSFVKIRPNLMNVNPANMLKNTFGLTALANLSLMSVKAVFMAILMFYTIRHVLPLVFSAAHQPLPNIALGLWTGFVQMLVSTLTFGIVLALIDLKIKRRQYFKSLRMSKDEVKREHLSQSGNENIKSERKKLGREMIMSGAPAKKIGLADAVIVNPTHYAVAIRYAKEENDLPYVLMKGKDKRALELRRLAAENHVPVIGNPTVARALYKVEEDSPIPEELFEAVAAILKWVRSVADANLSPTSAD
ncbi:type III secretion system protein HrcU [Caballeronia calidae]|uniref:Type III secretion system protein HrcU n=1 Tax=Caballeronia calidae TaxID=1777139 RepID=A0A158EGI8_9BURK|nr:EscU/YscU/HrcU family type III secretion system export apparatus switch protein [Caballeronia calidae]SAL05820.1 type III secretion system protein HrcU [Caballeronia calidae]